MEHFSRSRCRKKIPAAGQPVSNVHKRCLIYLIIHLVLKVWKMRRWMIPIPYKIAGKWSLHSLLKIIIKNLDHVPNNQEQTFNNPWNHHLTTPFASQNPTSSRPKTQIPRYGTCESKMAFVRILNKNPDGSIVPIVYPCFVEPYGSSSLMGKKQPKKYRWNLHFTHFCGVCFTTLLNFFDRINVE